MISFDVESYTNLLRLIEYNYNILGFKETKNALVEIPQRTNICCLRHDVDYCIDNAYAMAKLENELNVKSSYFFLVDSNNYNTLSKASRYMIYMIAKMGHEIALHFDVANYEPQDYLDKINLHKKCLEDICGLDVTSISYHNPGIVGLNNLNLDDTVCGLESSYARSLQNVFFYASDSLCQIKHPDLLQMIEEKKYPNIHLLIHPIWWMEVSQARDQKIQDNLLKKNMKLLDEYNDVLTKYGEHA